MDKFACPVCKSTSLNAFYTSKVPTLQNRVYPSQLDAQNCNQGLITLSYCMDCEFVFNSTFDSNLLVYDDNYNNNVPSKYFENYYKDIAAYLYEKYNLSGKVIYDIGCGKGIFLKLICSLYSDVRGIGIDPSYEGANDFAPNITFIPDFFSNDHVTEIPGLVLCRHVLEHMEQPKDFINDVFSSFKGHNDLPFFIEIPDFTWILANQTFWDICYEHTNYFSDTPLLQLFTNTNSQLDSIKRAFLDQYLWVEGLINPIEGNPSNLDRTKPITPEDIERFRSSISTNLENVINRITAIKDSGKDVIIWGMATKGVIYSNMLIDKLNLITACFDINTDKQDQYAPVSAMEILSPEKISSVSTKPLAVIVMNMNYANEINSWLSEHVDSYEIYDAMLNKLEA